MGGGVGGGVGGDAERELQVLVFGGLAQLDLDAAALGGPFEPG